MSYNRDPNIQRLGELPDDPPSISERAVAAVNETLRNAALSVDVTPLVGELLKTRRRLLDRIEPRFEERRKIVDDPDLSDEGRARRLKAVDDAIAADITATVDEYDTLSKALREKHPPTQPRWTPKDSDVARLTLAIQQAQALSPTETLAAVEAATADRDFVWLGTVLPVVRSRMETVEDDTIRHQAKAIVDRAEIVQSGGHVYANRRTGELDRRLRSELMTVVESIQTHGQWKGSPAERIRTHGGRPSATPVFSFAESSSADLNQLSRILPPGAERVDFTAIPLDEEGS